MNWPERVWIYSPLRPLFQRREINKWLKLAGRQDGKIALEIGCGLGKGAQLVRTKMGFSEIHAFDLEYKLVKWARNRLPEEFAGSISFFNGDAQDLPFKDVQFDAVINFGIIHHVLDWKRCLKEISRVLKPGGLFFFEEIYPPLYANPLFKLMLQHPVENRFYEADFISMLQSVGIQLKEGVKTGSSFGIVGAAQKV